MKLVFDIYDFDSDGYISKEDISAIFNYMPVTKANAILGEGSFTQDGGGALDFNERVETLQEMYRILDICFGDKVKINFKEFSKINEEIASDTLLSVLNLFRQKLPCSENFWRYKRNYELHMSGLEKEEQKTNGSDRHTSPSTQSTTSNGGEGHQKKILASP